MESCLFCHIAAGKVPCHKIYEDEHALAFLDIAKDFYGHTLVVPKAHFENILDCSKSSLEKVILAVQKVSQHFIENCGFKGVNVLNSNAEAAGQSVFHLHFHIIPRMNKSEFSLIQPSKELSVPDLAVQCEKLKMK